MVQPFVLDERLANDSHALATFSLCELRLMDDATYPWLLLVPRVAGAREVTDLDAPQRLALMQDIDRASRVLLQAVQPFKLNIGAIGNLVQQLHVHVVARFEGDPAWPAPVWGHAPMQRYAADALSRQVTSLRRRIEG